MSGPSPDSRSAPGGDAAAGTLRPSLASIEAAELRRLVLGAAVILALTFWLFWRFFAAQFRHAVEHQADWGHTLIIPLIAGYFVYFSRDRLLAKPFKTTWIGLIPIVIGGAWYMFCWLGPLAVRHHNLQGAGLTLTLFGVALLFCGFRAMLFLWFPLLYLCVFGQTVSERAMNLVTFPMQDITARGSHIFLNLIMIDTDRAGNILYIWSNGEAKPLNIAEACSGMRMLMAFMALGVAMAFTGLRHWWQRIALVAMGIPTAIFVNILRVATLAVLSMFDTDFAAGDFHTFIGLLWLVPAFLIYLGIMWTLRQLVIEDDAQGSSPGVVKDGGTVTG